MQDFTEGKIVSQVIRFCVPIILGNLLLSVYNIINMIWVGRLLGHTAVAAVSTVMPILMLLPAFLIGLAMATNVLISQAFGRKDIGLLRKILSNSFIASLVLCVLISIAGMLLRHKMLDWVHAPMEVRAMSLSYLTILMACLVPQFFLNWMTGMLRGMGDAKSALKILGLLTGFNIVLVPLFIRVFGLGVAGAAWGTVLASVATGAIGYAYLMRHNPYINVRTWDFGLDWHIVRQVFTIGVPASLQMIVTSLSGVLIVSLVNRYGTDVTAAFGIGMQIDMLVLLPSISIGMAVTSIAGQNLGAQRFDRVSAALKTSLLFGVGLALAGTLLLWLFPHQVGAAFLRESAERTQVLGQVAGYYRWMAFTFPCLAVMFALQGVLRASGDTVSLLVLALVSFLAIRIPLAHWLADTRGFAQNGIWMAMLFSALAGALLSWAYYATGRWKKMRVLK